VPEVRGYLKLKKGDPVGPPFFNLVEAAKITPPYKSIAYVAKRQKCPRGYPQINPAE
jgi:hypothetical protein